MTRAVVHLGDSRQVLQQLADASVDAVVTDPPYELAFMGKRWDASGVAYDVELWRQVARVLKPGGHLLAFGATRTFHRMVCAVEDAGLEVRDTITWLRGGQSMPKSMNVAKALDKLGEGDAARAWDGWGTALKPAQEPILVARKPLDGTVAANVLAHGVGGLNIDGTRVAHASAKDLAAHQAQVGAIKARGGSMGNSWKNTSDLSGANDVNLAGRWPPNAVLSHAPECGATCAAGCPVAELDGQSGTLKSGVISAHHKRRTAGGNGVTHGAMAGILGESYGDSGGASRFFPAFRYVAKPSRRERDAGLEAAPTRDAGAAMNTRCSGCGRLKLDHRGSACSCSTHTPAERTSRAGVKNHHPTVKPVALMRWLVRLVTPRNGLVLDPFTGSGTTGVACVLEDVRFVGVEQSNEYRDLALARISAAQADRSGEQLDLWSDE